MESLRTQIQGIPQEVHNTGTAAGTTWAADNQIGVVVGGVTSADTRQRRLSVNYISAILT